MVNPEQNTSMSADIAMMAQSIALLNLSGLQSVRWNKHGIVKETGVEAIVPIKERNLSNLFYKSRQTTMVKSTMQDLKRFFNHCLFFDFGIFLKM